MILLWRGVLGVWFLGAVIFVIIAVADLLFGNGPFGERARDFLPRVAVSVVWPLAAITPRGRYLLWARWRR